MRVTEERLLRELFKELGDEGLTTSGYGRALYRRDAGFLNAEPLAVCFPGDTEQLAAVVRLCAEEGVGFVPRGGGTGLAGGAVPLGNTVVVSLARMNRILELNPAGRYAWVEPGVENSRLNQAAGGHGLRYAPDPSSQIACSIGGNVGTNAGGAHCLAHGVTSWHVEALDLMDAQGRIHRVGSLAPEHGGYDVRGLVVGSEGTFGIVTRVCVRLSQLPEYVSTLLLSFAGVSEAAQASAAILAAGCVPVALELMDRASVQLVEGFAGVTYPVDAGAILIVEFEGLEHDVARGVLVAQGAAAEFGGRIRAARQDADRERLWKGRKAIAGAIARVAEDYYLHDVVVPRSRLAEVLEEVLHIGYDEGVSIVNVAHAGDGNLHPLILFDRRDREVLPRVFRAGDRIVRAAVDAGGALSGEHGIGLEKRTFLHDPDVMDPAELELHVRLRQWLEPTGLVNPGKKIVPPDRGASHEGAGPAPAGTWI